MRKQVQIALAILFVALVSVIVWQMLQPGQREPVYHGKLLSSWVKDYALAFRLPPNAALNMLNVDEAVRQAGTNAIPTLLRMLRAKDSALKVKLMALAQRQHIINIEYTSAEKWNWAAPFAFGVLGARAQSAVPALIEIANRNISPASQCSAIMALGYIGPSAKEAVPSLLRWATNADAEVREISMVGLGEIGAEPDRVAPCSYMPCMTQTLESKARRLGHLGTLDLMPSLQCPHWSNFSTTIRRTGSVPLKRWVLSARRRRKPFPHYCDGRPMQTPMCGAPHLRRWVKSMHKLTGLYPC